MSGATTPLATTSALPLRMAWGIVLINLFVFGMAGFVLYQSHGEYEERSGMIAQNLSRMLALDMSREFDKIDVTLLVAQDEIEGQLARGIDAAHLNDFLRRLKEHVPEIISLRMADERGIVRYGVGVDPRVRIDNSDREYFIRQRTDPHSGLLVSAPLMARIDKRWVVVVSRALRRADGSFAGIVYANVSIDHLVQLLSSVEVGPRDSSSLRDTGLRIYARYPVPKDVGQVYGKRLEVPELQALIDAGQDAGTYISSHTVDGVERRFAVRRVDKLPLYVVVGRASDEYMLPWRKQAEQTLAVSLLFFLTSLAASWLIYRSWHSQMSATAVLAREEEKFHTVADHTYDWEYWEGPQGEIRYMSPSCQRVTGYAQSEFVADPALLQRIVHPDDRALLAAHRHDIEHKEEAALDFRILRWDGETRWLAHVCQAVFGRDGQYMGRRVSNRDITSFAFYRSRNHSGQSALLAQTYPDGYVPEINQYSKDRSLVAGVKGNTDSGWTWDLSLNHGENTLDFHTRNSINYSLGATSPRSFYDGTLKYQQDIFNADLTKSLDWGLAYPVTLSFGGEYRKEKWDQKPGELNSYTGSGAQGFAGFTPTNEVHADRHNYAVYAGLEADLTEKFSAGITGRYEDYSDFGDRFSGKLSARYAFTDKVALRATASSGFRAPSLAQQGYQAVTSQFLNGVYVERGTFPTTSPAAQALGASPLKAETSTSYSLGLVLQPVDRLYITVDAYQIDIDDRIALSSSITTNAATSALLGTLGLPQVTAFSYFTNGLDTRTRGVDFGECDSLAASRTATRATRRS